MHSIISNLEFGIWNFYPPTHQKGRGGRKIRNSQFEINGSVTVRYDDPNVAASAVVGIISAILLFVIIVVLQAFFYRAEQGELERKVYSQPYQALQQLDANQLELLNSYGWVSEAEGTVHVPIDRAMELIAAEQQQRTP
jgi:hypothetical protein